MIGVKLNLGASELADLLAIHLQDEEAVLTAALPVVRALKAALTERTAEPPPEPGEQHQAIIGLLVDIRTRRQRFRELLARRFDCAAETINVSRILNGLPAQPRATLGACAERIRRMASEVVEINRWLTIHLRIHLDAYQRLLCDLTGSAHSSGRYGPAGKAETGELRPLIQIQG